jgi:hypothetical protein
LNGVRGVASGARALRRAGPRSRQGHDVEWCARQSGGRERWLDGNGSAVVYVGRGGSGSRIAIAKVVRQKSGGVGLADWRIEPEFDHAAAEANGDELQRITQSAEARFWLTGSCLATLTVRLEEGVAALDLNQLHLRLSRNRVVAVRVK